MRFAGVLASVLAVATPARADFGHLVRAGTSLTCTSLTDCSSGAACTGPLETCRSLTDASGTTTLVCARDPAQELFCCMSDSDCPTVGGVTGTCADFHA